MEYKVYLLEETWDAFDDFAGYNPLGFLPVNAISPKEAAEIGIARKQPEITEMRRKGGFMSSGMFFVVVDKVTDKDDNVLYQADLREYK